jgi:hypothetical protein
MSYLLIYLFVHVKQKLIIQQYTLIKYHCKTRSIYLFRFLTCRDELAIVESFASSLPVDTWVSCKFEMINRPVAPVLVLLHKKWSEFQWGSTILGLHIDRIKCYNAWCESCDADRTSEWMRKEFYKGYVTEWFLSIVQFSWCESCSGALWFWLAHWGFQLWEIVQKLSNNRTKREEKAQGVARLNSVEFLC